MLIFSWSTKQTVVSRHVCSRCANAEELMCAFKTDKHSVIFTLPHTVNDGCRHNWSVQVFLLRCTCDILYFDFSDSSRFTSSTLHCLHLPNLANSFKSLACWAWHAIECLGPDLTPAATSLWTHRLLAMHVMWRKGKRTRGQGYVGPLLVDQMHVCLRLCCWME